jgi:hypothetical protein
MSRPVPVWLWGAGAVAVLVVLGSASRSSAPVALPAGGGSSSSGERWTWGRPNSKDPWGNIIYRDPNSVVPAFADKIERVIRRLRARGYDAVVHEAYRTPARAARLSDVGTGISKSLHSYNGAVDIVDQRLGWGATEAFKNAVVQEVEREGLMSGRRFSNKDDWAHAQAVQTNKVAQFIASNLEQRNRMVA